ncbi:hypothetical protein [Halomontanus rarus]|nr:hypothetical protein [Halovivax sp. TS33]
MDRDEDEGEGDDAARGEEPEPVYRWSMASDGLLSVISGETATDLRVHR